MICSAITTLRRNGEDVRVIVTADTRSPHPIVDLRLDRVDIFTAADILPCRVEALTDEEGSEIERLLEVDLAVKLAEVAALPERVRRLAESLNINAPLARALAVEAGTEVRP